MATAARLPHQQLGLYHGEGIRYEDIGNRYEVTRPKLWLWVVFWMETEDMTERIHSALDKLTPLEVEIAQILV
jgi:hypothetical protein